MPQIVSYNSVIETKQSRIVPGGATAWRTDFICTGPMAFLAEGSSGRVELPHFHECDQFQVVVSGSGMLGPNKLSPGDLRFTRAHTAYGPISYGDQGLGFLTLRPCQDPGAQYISEHSQKLLDIQDRNPWQVTTTPVFLSSTSIAVINDVVDSYGLCAYSVTADSNTSVTLPAPGPEGQYVVITDGSIVDHDKLVSGLTVIWIDKHEQPYTMHPGPTGAKALVLNFPTKHQVRPQALAHTWHCELCGFVYNEEHGLPESAIPSGTQWNQVPDTFVCPDCSVPKAAFVNTGASYFK